MTDTGNHGWRTGRADRGRPRRPPAGSAPSTAVPRKLPRGITLIYEDADLLVVDKPPGLLTIGTDVERERTAYFVLTDYVRRGQRRSRNRVFIVHRLDRETSGILVFARHEEGKRRLQEGWDGTSKQYLAVVHGRCPQKSGTISTLLAENKARGVYTTSDPARGRLSHTAYRVLKETARFSLLEVDLLTGRKHQIRVHLAGIGNPIVGDRRYGLRDSLHRHLALHARSLSFVHPMSGKRLSFTVKAPSYFGALVGGLEGLVE